MTNRKQEILSAVKETLGLTLGYKTDHPPLGTLGLDQPAQFPRHQTLMTFYHFLLDNPRPLPDQNPLWNTLLAEYQEAIAVLSDYYSDEDQYKWLQDSLRKIRTSGDQELKAQLLSQIWLPELRMDEPEIKSRWKLTRVEKNPRPFKPTQLTIQFNGLYTLPEKLPVTLPAQLKQGWQALKDDPGRKVADYDHPVPLFEQEKDHELLRCLRELDGDLDFEKEMGVLPKEHKVLVTLSLSVTHEKLDTLCEQWIKHLLKINHYSNIRCLILSETNINHIKKELLKGDFPVYSVFGKYAKHFNALKYTQLLLEEAYGIKAGFKLDTDEGIRSRDLYTATGKTWFQTMCHEYWGGTAQDWKGRECYLDINEGEYINSTDIDRFGYTQSLRTPDVKLPSSYQNPEIFFNKGFGFGQAVALYNQYEKLKDFISHPVVKGGGYGISNNGLRQALPFAFSQVGRAEDQQFYFSGLARGIRGIFHPDLRIAHYKQAVAGSEQKTKVSRFMGDMFRLVIFQELADLLHVKEEIDPMPGMFAGGLARAQAFFHILYTAHGFYLKGNEEAGDQLLKNGLQELKTLKTAIDKGDIKRALAAEKRSWEDFVKAADSLTAAEIKIVLDSLLI